MIDVINPLQCLSPITIRTASITGSICKILLALSLFITFEALAFADEQGLPVRSIFPAGLPTLPSDEFDDPALVAYGQFLFGSSLLSRDQSVACTTCHDLSRALSGPAPLATGIGGAVGRRHPPPLLNLYAARRLMWDGRAPNLSDQIQLPLQSRTEMDIDWTAALRRLSEHEETRALLPANRAIDRMLVLSALAAYVRSIVTGGSDFDRYYFQGDDSTLSEQAKSGLILFIRRGRCSTCHSIDGYSAPLTDNSFHSIGIGFEDGAYKDAGRFEVTAKEADRGLFKTPTLRNVALRSYFMHDGSMTSLREVVDYYDKGGNRGAPNLDERIRPLFMTAQEKEDLLAFLKSLNAPIVSYRPL